MDNIWFTSGHALDIQLAAGLAAGTQVTRARRNARRNADKKRQGLLFSLKDSLSFLYPAVSCTDIFQIFPARFLSQFAFAILALS